MVWTSDGGNVDPADISLGTQLRNVGTGRTYVVKGRLGEGGFGAAYTARQVRGAPRRKGLVCLKVARDPEAWHREAYFGELLQGVPGAVAIYDSFATPLFDGGDGRVWYCLVSELAENGDLFHYLSEERSWTERKIVRQTCKLLQVLIHLHDAGAVHRDITPRNVFVTAAETLKLGDFGISRHRKGKKNLRADVFAGWFVPTGVEAGAQRTWGAADDVYQVGLIMAGLIGGSVDSKLTAEEVRLLPCSTWMKSIVQRAIGERRKRFPDAGAMLKAIKEGESTTRRLRGPGSLRAKVVVFTGRLSMTRKEAARLATAVGAVVRQKIAADTDVVVVGEAAPDFKAGSKGQKLLDVQREMERGHTLALIDERRFLALVGLAPAPGKKRPA